jgi:phage-related baseplate assembly protein
MSRFTPIDLSVYRIDDIIEALDFEAYLARDRAEFIRRWDTRRAANPALPAMDTLLLESDPASVVMETGVWRETVLRARVNDAIRDLSLAGARGPALDHIMMTYYRGLARRVITPADNGAPAVFEDDETARQRTALAPESWAVAGPEGAYLFHALSASGDVLDVAVYSEDEGVTLAPRIRMVVLSRLGDGTASPALIETVRASLSRGSIRPLGDLVTAESAGPLTFDVAVTLRLRQGASAAMIAAQAEARIRQYTSGRLRWIGDGLTGPVWLIGRRLRRETIAAAALGGDGNILEVVVNSPVADVNAPHAGYTAAALAGVGTLGFAPLDPAITAHLFRAPRVGAITVTTEIVNAGWS